MRLRPDEGLVVAAVRDPFEGHARQEEEVDFPKLRAILDDRSIMRLSGTVQREKALVL